MNPPQGLPSMLMICIQGWWLGFLIGQLCVLKH